MSSDVLVSISCTTYNHAPYIRECLEGFLMQKCDFAYEILIHDDASTDGTIDIIKEYQEKYPEIIKPYIQKENQWSKGVRGMNAKYNFSRAQGKYIALCEGDDYWTDPLKLQKQVDFLEENPDYVLTGHLRIVVDENGNELPHNKYRKNSLYTQCLLFRNILKDDFLNYKSNISNGDTFLITYLRNFGKVKVFDFVGSAYRVSNSGVWSKKEANFRNSESRKSLLLMLEFFKKYKYYKSEQIIKGYLIDNEISYHRHIKEMSFSNYIKLVIKCLLQIDFGRLKTITKMYFK